MIGFDGSVRHPITCCMVQDSSSREAYTGRITKSDIKRLHEMVTGGGAWCIWYVDGQEAFAGTMPLIRSTYDEQESAWNKLDD